MKDPTELLTLPLEIRLHIYGLACEDLIFFDFTMGWHYFPESRILPLLLVCHQMRDEIKTEFRPKTIRLQLNGHDAYYRSMYWKDITRVIPRQIRDSTRTIIFSTDDRPAIHPITRRNFPNLDTVILDNLIWSNRACPLFRNIWDQTPQHEVRPDDSWDSVREGQGYETLLNKAVENIWTNLQNFGYRQKRNFRVLCDLAIHMTKAEHPYCECCGISRRVLTCLLDCDEKRLNLAEDWFFISNNQISDVCKDRYRESADKHGGSITTECAMRCQKIINGDFCFLFAEDEAGILAAWNCHICEGEYWNRWNSF